MSRNGELRDDELTRVQGSIYLAHATAEAYLAMKRAAAADGVALAIPTPAGGYRSLYMQADMHANPERYNLDPNSTVPLAPVGRSTHGLGTRVDIVTGAARRWAIDNCHRFGFEREFGSADPGHFMFRGFDLPSLPTIPIDQEEDDMTLELIKTPDGTVWWCVNRVLRYPIPGVRQLATYQAHLRNLGRPDHIVSKSHDEIKAYGAVVR